MSHSRDPTRLLGRLELRTKYLLFGALFYPVIAVSSNLQNGFRVRFWKLNQVHATYLVPFGLSRWAKTTEEKGEIERGGDVKSFWAVSARTARVPGGATTATATTKGGRERAARHSVCPSSIGPLSIESSAAAVPAAVFVTEGFVI